MHLELLNFIDNDKAKIVIDAVLKGRKHICLNCEGNYNDYYGDGYPCDQCQLGWQYPDEYKEKPCE